MSHGKVTPAVRKILQSQKTFANHLSDAEALAALAAANPQSQSQTLAAPATPAVRASPAPQPGLHKRSHKKKGNSAAAASATPLRRISTAAAAETPAVAKAEQPDTVMADAPALRAPSPGFTPHPGDSDPLLKSRIPPMPTAAEVAALVAAPPLAYLEAKAKVSGADLRVPPRRFCEICGYWGRVKCTKCGSRCCALECLRTHQEECYTRYGA